MTVDLRAVGVAVGHATDTEGATGVTVVRGIDAPLRAGASVFGRATGERELHTLAVDHLVERIDAPLGRVELTQLARAAGAALFRRITPTGTSVDGDIVFAVAPAGPPKALGTATMSLEALAVAALEGAIERAVRTARGREGVLGLAD